jgi:glycosyltransferase involved in cell wall biosynthesis
MQHKGLDLLLSGFALYLKCGGQGELWIIGGGTERRDLEVMAAQLGVESNVTFYGEIHGAEKTYILEQADCFMHVSRWDGMPLACLEAAAMALPLIISPATNLVEQVLAYNAGFEVPEPSAKAVAQSMAHAFDAWRAGVLDVQGANAARMVESIFSWQRVGLELTQAITRANSNA